MPPTHAPKCSLKTKMRRTHQPNLKWLCQPQGEIFNYVKVAYFGKKIIKYLKMIHRLKILPRINFYLKLPKKAAAMLKAHYQ